MTKQFRIMLFANLLLIVMTNFHYSTSNNTTSVPNRSHIDSQNAYDPLPRRCMRTTPPGQAEPACCITGVVWFDGQAISGASVIIQAPNGRSLRLQTLIDPDVAEPYYNASLSASPLNIESGQIITITAQYSSHQTSITHRVQQGGQMADIVLSRNFLRDYAVVRETIPQPEERKYNDPVSLDHDSQGNLYVLDRETSVIQKLNPDGQLLARWGKRGSGRGEFLFPENIHIDDYDNVYVADTFNHRVQKFNGAGGFITEIGSFTQGHNSIDRPQDVVTDKQGLVYIADWNGVHKFDVHGNYINKIMSIDPEYEYYASIIAIDRSSENNIIIHNIIKTIYIYSPNGNFISEWNIESILAEDIMVGPSDNIYFSLGNGLVHVYSISGNFIRTLGIGVGANIPNEHEPALGEIQYAVSSSIDNNGVISIVDITQWWTQEDLRIHRYDSSNTWIGAWGGKSKGPNQFFEPIGVQTMNQTVIINDEGNQRLSYLNTDFSWIGAKSLELLSFVTTKSNYIFTLDNIRTPTNGYITRLTKRNSQGDSLLSWDEYPTAKKIALGPDDIIYLLTDNFKPNQRVLQVNQSGQLLRTLTLPKLPEEHYGFDQIAIDSQGSLYITDGYEIYRFNSQGNRLQTWIAGDAYISGIGIDSSDAIFAVINEQMLYSEQNRYNIRIFNKNGTFLGAWGKYGRGIGEIIIRCSNVAGDTMPAFDNYNNVYIPDTCNNRIQSFRPMTYTRPIATINWVNRTNLIQGEHNLTALASAADSDEDGQPASFTYSWYVDNQRVGLGRTLNIAAIDLPVGASELSLEVMDDEGEISKVVSVPLEVSPPPTADWTFMLYMVADSRADGEQLLRKMDRGFENEGLLDRIKKQQTLNPNHTVQVVVQIDGLGFGNTRRMVLNSVGEFEIVPSWPREVAMDTPQEIGDFVRWTRDNRPAEHYYLAILSHGNGYQGVAWDDTSGPNSYLSMAELREALTIASSDGAAPIDILHLDACSMSLLDAAYELRDHVRYFIASQNLGWSFFLQDRYRESTIAGTSPIELGKIIINTYADFAEQQSQAGVQDQFPYTISLLDLTRADSTVKGLNLLARELGASAVRSSSNRALLADIRDASQKFDSQDIPKLTTLDEYVDLVDWARKVRNNSTIANPAIVSQIDILIEAVQGSNPFVILQRNSGNRLAMPPMSPGFPGGTIDLRGSNGISLYYPHPLSPSVSTVIWQRYHSDQLFQMTQGELDNWDEFLLVGYKEMPNPSDPLPEPGKPPIFMEPTITQVFIPLALR